MVSKHNNERTHKLTQAKFNIKLKLKQLVDQTEQQIIDYNDAYIYTVFPQNSNVQNFFQWCKYWLKKIIKPV